MSSITVDDLAECIRLAEDGDPNVKIEALTSKGTMINAKGEERPIDEQEKQFTFTHMHLQILQIFGAKKDFLDNMSYDVIKITNINEKGITLLNPVLHILCPDNDDKIPTQYVMRRGERSKFIEKYFNNIKNFDDFKFPFTAQDMKPLHKYETMKYEASYLTLLQMSEIDKTMYYKQTKGTKESISLGKTLRPFKPVWIAFKANGLEKVDVRGDIQKYGKRRQK